ncbi:MAG: ABC transporter substrate-binding protein [Deltaproteobacteria bacterium]|nr:ABC transporter substrate-binding protein [Deltaproteobacteria bacterium]
MKRIKGGCPSCLLFPTLIMVIAVCLAGIAGCDKKEQPIKIGFVGGLTGRFSDLDTSGRNGVLLAIEQINRAGGIHGRPVELIIKDDRHDPREALRVDQELIDEGVVAIIGHMASAMSTAVLPLINKEKILMVSPTTSTDQLTGIDDYFIRVMPSNKAEADYLARYAYSEMGIKKIAAVYDLANRAYTEGFLDNFRRAFERLGGKVIFAEPYTSGEGTDFAEVAVSLIRPYPDAVLVVAGSLDAAMICQHIRMNRATLPIFSCGWAMTDAFVKHGGPAVEGVMFSQLFDEKCQDRRYVTFKRKYKERFGEEPDFAAVHGYEAAGVILKVLSKNSDPETLKATLLKQRIFQGVQGDFNLDAYGDPQRRRILITVKGGAFQRKHN